MALLQGQKAWRVLARWLLGALDRWANTGVQQADPPLLAVSDGFVAIPKGSMLLEYRLDFRSDHGVSYLLLSKRLPLHTGGPGQLLRASPQQSAAKPGLRRVTIS